MNKDPDILRTPVLSCPACFGKRRHTEEDWKHHPERGSGYAKDHGMKKPEVEKVSEVPK